MSAKLYSIALLAVASLLLCANPARAQGPNLSGTWVGKDGSETTFSHGGTTLSGKSWGGKNNSTLTGSMRLSLSSERPLIYRGTYEGRQGNLTGSGTISITVHDNNKIFVSYKGTVTDGRQTSPVSDSGFAVRK